MGRPRIYENGAEKQKAYRERAAEKIERRKEMGATAREIAAIARKVGIASEKAPDWDALRTVADMLSRYPETRTNCD